MRSPGGPWVQGGSCPQKLGIQWETLQQGDQSVNNPVLSSVTATSIWFVTLLHPGLYYSNDKLESYRGRPGLYLSTSPVEVPASSSVRHGKTHDLFQEMTPSERPPCWHQVLNPRVNTLSVQEKLGVQTASPAVQLRSPRC